MNSFDNRIRLYDRLVFSIRLEKVIGSGKPDKLNVAITTTPIITLKPLSK